MIDDDKRRAIAVSLLRVEPEPYGLVEYAAEVSRTESGEVCRLVGDSYQVVRLTLDYLAELIYPEGEGHDE